VKAALYCRVSTFEQTTENQRLELGRYCEARGWTATEYLDEGVSGSKESRPALDRLLTDARRHRFDTLIVWRLDRLGRNLRHLILLLDELSALGVAFVSLNEGIDTTTPAGRLQLHLLGAVAEYERGVIAERVKLGMARAKAQGKPVGRPRRAVTDIHLAAVAHLPVRQAALALGVSKSFVANWRVSTRVVETGSAIERNSSGIPTCR
jgi:DNA invertase Pin-like site-specific DNA recombinase